MVVAEPPLMKGFGVLATVCLLILSSVDTATAAATTDPKEVKALNAILGRWELTANSHWNISGEPCSGWAIDDALVNIDNNGDFNPGIKCDCTYNSNKTCHIITLKVYQLGVTGTIPVELQNLTYLNNLNLARNYLTGSVPAFMGNLSRMEYLTFGLNALSGAVPKELGNLQKLISLGMDVNNFTGSLPDEFGNLTNLEQLYISNTGLSGQLPATLSNLKKMKILWASDCAFTGKFPNYIGTWTDLQDLRFQGISFEGPIPSSFSNLVKLNSLRIGDITNGTSSTLDFVSNLTSLSTLILRNCKISDTLSTDFSKFQNLQLLDLSFNNITGNVPQSLFRMNSLKYLFLGNNSLSGSLPSQKSTTLLNIDLSYNLLSGSYPSWVSQKGNLQLNLIANNFVIQSSNSSVLPSGLECLQRDIPCHKGSPIYSSFAIRCGGDSLTAQDGTMYQADNANLSAASYYVTSATRWGVSNVGTFVDGSSNNYILGTITQFQNTLDSALFQKARMSPSSLRYYGFGLENGNYTVKLQFAEVAYLDPPSWKSHGRRVFDIFIQGALKEKDFDIRKSAGGSSFIAVVKNYIVPVTNNFIEIHFFWAGKGTCCIPSEGYYGPTISAISVSPFDFTPTVSNREPSSSKSKTGLIIGVLAGVAVLGLVVFLAVLYWRHKKKMSEIDEELFGIVDRPDVFSYAELRTATDAFSDSNVLGEGGYGPVYKGKLSDDRIVAVKQLAVTSHQGKREFLTEISTISAVQHKNLVKLYGCCIDGNNRLLVYEFLENGSLDQALFGKRILYLDWATRFDICLAVARGLAYLHEESSVRIIHRDIKASNILLDSDLNPKISDFGLAKLYEENKTHISTKVAGTIGYLAPEYAMRGHLTEKTDVFSFGVVVLEVVAGRSNTDMTLTQDQIYLLEWAWSLYEQDRAIELLDPKLASYDKDGVLRLITVSLLCTQAAQRRPSMSRVVAMLTGDLEVNKVNFKPSYLTDWHFKDITDNEFSTGESSVPATRSSTNRGVPGVISKSNSSDVLMDSIIQEGR